MVGRLGITSPPYANNYDYADATRLEMTFWGDINGWADLQDNVRKPFNPGLYSTCIETGRSIDSILSNPRLAPIQNELFEVYETLKVERLSLGGKRTITL